MAYLISEEAQDLLQDVKNFCDKEVAEQCKEYDVSGEWPKAIYDKAVEQGYQALEVPEEFGGPGLSRVDVAALIEQMAIAEQKENFRVDRLKFIGSSVKRPVISDICKTKGVVVNILGAAVQELEDSVMCVFILQLIGDDESIDKAEAEIDKNGVLRERLEVE